MSCNKLGKCGLRARDSAGGCMMSCEGPEICRHHNCDIQSRARYYDDIMSRARYYDDITSRARYYDGITSRARYYDDITSKCQELSYCHVTEQTIVMTSWNRAGICDDVIFRDSTLPIVLSDCGRSISPFCQDTPSHMCFKLENVSPWQQANITTGPPLPLLVQRLRWWIWWCQVW